MRKKKSNEVDHPTLERSDKMETICGPNASWLLQRAIRDRRNPIFFQTIFIDRTSVFRLDSANIVVAYNKPEYDQCLVSTIIITLFVLSVVRLPTNGPNLDCPELSRF